MSSISLPLLTFWACILSAVYRPVMQSYENSGLGEVISTGIGANYIVWFSLIIATLSLKDRIINIHPILLGFAMLLMVYPSSILSWIAASLIAFALVWNLSGNLAALLLFATALREPFTTICMKIFAGGILGLDALMTNAMLVLMGSPSLIQSNLVITENGHPLLILTGCSVFTNLSYNSLLWFSLHLFFEKKVTPLSWLILGVTILMTLVSNAIRLALMTGSQGAYVFYHDGLGSKMFEWGLLALVIILVLGGCRYAKTV